MGALTAGVLRSLLVGAMMTLTAGLAAAQARGDTLEASLLRVESGDTIRVRLPDGREETVRYIGISTPEIPHPTKGKEPYREAAAAAHRELMRSKTVQLTFDAQTRDRDGRLLAYAFADGIHVNAELVHRGYAEAASYPPNVRYAEYYRALQYRARAAGRGLWGDAEALQHHRPDPEALEARMPWRDPSTTVWPVPPPRPAESLPVENPVVVVVTPPPTIYPGILILPSKPSIPPLRPPPRPRPRK
ncbi:MAG: thermonuclease family protein [Candidatus Rokuibacteriota bacterium]